MKNKLLKDALAEDPYACLALAYFMHTGKELDQNLPEAVIWYERAAELGCARAHWELTRMYMEGDAVEYDPEKSLEHLISSARIGNADAQIALAMEFVYGEMLEHNLTQAFKWLLKAAEQGVTIAKFAVGYMYAHGLGVSRSNSEAEMWFSSAAITGHGDLFLEIGLRFEYGLDGINHNEVEAARWYKYGVDMGHEKCILCWNSVMNSLGGAEREPFDDRVDRLSMTSSQREVDERIAALEEADGMLGGDDAIAYEMYSRAADLGSSEAMFSKAMMLHQGIGVKRDDAEAIRILSRAADAGSEDAQFFLARIYESGRFPTDYSQIVKLYSDAAFNGFLAAYYYLSKYVDRPEIYVRRTHARY